MATSKRAITFLTARNGKGFEMDVVDVEEMKRQKAMAEMLAKAKSEGKEEDRLLLNDSTILSPEAEERVKKRLNQYNFADAFAKLELIPEPEPVGIEESLARLGMRAKKKKKNIQSSAKTESPKDNLSEPSPVLLLEITHKTDSPERNSTQMSTGPEPNSKKDSSNKVLEITGPRHIFEENSSSNNNSDKLDDNLDPNGMPKLDPVASHPGSYVSQKTDLETLTAETRSVRSSRKTSKTSDTLSVRSGKKTPVSAVSGVSESHSARSNEKTPIRTATQSSVRSSRKTPDQTASGSPSYRSSAKTLEQTASGIPSVRSSKTKPDQTVPGTPRSYMSSTKTPEPTASGSPSYRPDPTASGPPSGVSSRKTLDKTASGPRSATSVSNRSSKQPSSVGGAIQVAQGTGSSRQVTVLPSTSILKMESKASNLLGESPSELVAQPHSAVSWAGQNIQLISENVLDTPRMTASRHGSYLGSQENVATQANLDPSSIGIIDNIRKDGYGTPSTVVSPNLSRSGASKTRLVETASGMPILLTEVSAGNGTSPSYQVNLNPSDLKLIESPPTTIESPGLGTQANLDASTINYFAGPDAQHFKTMECQTDFSLTPSASQASSFEDLDEVYNVAAQTSFSYQSGVFWEDLDSKVEFEIHEEDQSTMSEEKPKKKFPARLFLDDEYLFGPLRPVGETVKPWPKSAQEPIVYERDYGGGSQTSLVTQQIYQVIPEKKIPNVEVENIEEEEVEPHEDVEGEGEGEEEQRDEDAVEEPADGIEIQDGKSSVLGSKRGSIGSRSSQKVERSESKVASIKDASIKDASMGSKRELSIGSKDSTDVRKSASDINILSDETSKHITVNEDVKSIAASQMSKHTASGTSFSRRKSETSQGGSQKASIHSAASVVPSQHLEEEEEDFITENLIPSEEKNINPFLDDCHLLGPLRTIDKDHKASWDRDLLTEKREPDPNFIEHEMGIVLMDLASKHPQPLHSISDDAGEPPYDPCNFFECPKDLLSYSKLQKKVDFVDDAELASPLRTVRELSSLYHDPFALYSPLDSCHWRLGQEDTPQSSKESMHSERSFNLEYEEEGEVEEAPMVLPPVKPRYSFLSFAKKMSIEEPEGFEELEETQGDQDVEELIEEVEEEKSTGCFGRRPKSKKKPEKRPIFNPGGTPATEEETIALDDGMFDDDDDDKKKLQPQAPKKKKSWMCSLCCGANKQESHEQLPTDEKVADEKDAEEKQAEEKQAEEKVEPCEHQDGKVSCFGRFKEKCCCCCGRKESVPVVLLEEETEDEVEEEEGEQVIEYIEMDTYTITGDEAEPPPEKLADFNIPYRKFPRVKTHFKEEDLPSCGSRFNDLTKKSSKQEGTASGSQRGSTVHSGSCTSACTTCTDEQEWFERLDENESKATIASNTTIDTVKGYYNKDRKKLCGPPYQPCNDRFVVDFKPGFKMTLKIGCAYNDCHKEQSYFMNRSLTETPEEGPLFSYQSSDDPNHCLVHEGGDCHLKADTYSLQQPNLESPTINIRPKINLKERFATEDHVIEVISTEGEYSVDEYLPADNHRNAVEYTQEELHVDSSLPIIDIDAHSKFTSKKNTMVYPAYKEIEPTKASVLDIFDASKSVVMGNGEDLIVELGRTKQIFADPRRFIPQLYARKPPPPKPAPRPPKSFNPWNDIDNCTIPDWSYFRYDPKDPYTIDYSSDIYWLTCRRCKKRFRENNKPIQLICGHWLCRPCIEDLMEGKRDFDTFPCFQCRAKIQVPIQRFKPFKVCYFINNLRIVTEAMEKIEGISCPSDKGHGEATHRCRYCRLDFCGTCAADHHIHYPEHITGTRIAILLEEARDVLPKPPIFCQQHSTKEISHYCNQCRRPVCEECYARCSKVKGHYLRKIGNFVPYAKFFITTYMKEQLTIAIKDVDHSLQEMTKKKRIFASQYQYNSFSKLEGRRRQGHQIVNKMKNKLISEIDFYIAQHDRYMKLLEREDIFHKIKLFEVSKFIILVKSIAYDDELNKLTDTVFDNVLMEAIHARDVLQYKGYVELNRVGMPHFRYGAKLEKSRLIKKFRAMPYPIDKIAIGNDVIVCLHFSQLINQDKNSVVVVLTKNEQAHQLWMKMIHNQCPTARDIAFVNIHEKSQKLAIITEKEGYAEPGTCKQHCITLINPALEPPVVKYIMMNQKPLGVVNNPTPGFYYAHGCPPKLPIMISHWKEDGDLKTIYDAGETSSTEDSLQHVDYMCTNSKGHVIICDRKLNKLVLIEENGFLYRQDMAPHYKSDIPPKPCGVCVDKKDNIYVVQTPNHVVLRYGFDLTFKDVFLTQYDGLKEPISIASMGNYLVIGSLDGTISFFEIESH